MKGALVATVDTDIFVVYHFLLLICLIYHFLLFKFESLWVEMVIGQRRRYIKYFAANVNCVAFYIWK